MDKLRFCDLRVRGPCLSLRTFTVVYYLTSEYEGPVSHSAPPPSRTS